MAAPPVLFDRPLIRRRRARRARGFAAADVLVRHVAADLSERLAAIARPFPRALDLGTHGGLLAQAIASPGRTVICADSAAAMLPPGGGVVADEEWLPFADESLDLVVSGLTLHLVNDLPGTLIQINRALRPDGLMIVTLLGGDTLVELRAAMTMAEAEIAGGASPRVAPMLDIRDAGALLQRAGFALPVADSERLTLRYPDPWALMRDLASMAQTNPLAARRRNPATRALLTRAVALYRDRFSDPDGRVRATFELVTLTGWAPHDSQQKPLAPGSARMRLADALGARERGAGERAGPLRSPPSPR